MRTAHRTLPSRSPAVMATVAAVCLGVQPLLAQQSRPDTPLGNAVRISGRVVDRETGDPVSRARVEIRRRVSGARARFVDTDTLGAFAFDGVAAGLYSLRIERLGYRQLTDTVRVTGEGETVVTASMVTEAVDLEPLVVTAVRRESPFMRGFEQRRARGIGSFITREEIEDRHPFLASDLFRTLPGIRIAPGNAVDGARLVMRGQCQPKLYIDGVPEFEGISIDHAVKPVDIEAIEVYSTAGVPPRFSGNACGVVLVWTRVPQPVRSDTSFWKRLAIVGGLLLGGFLVTR